MSAKSPSSLKLSNFWDQFSGSYRSREIEKLAQWIRAGESGSVVGLVGSGRATLLSYLCQRPEILDPYLEPVNRQVILVPIDLADLPKQDLSTLYRTILRAFYEIRSRFDEPTQKLAVDLYRRVEASADPFLAQSALRELLFNLQAKEVGVALVLHNFVRFCKDATPDMTQTMRGLRNSFRETVFYLVGLPQAVIYLSHLESMSPLQGLLDTNICWIGPLNKADMSDMLAFRSRHQAKKLTTNDLNNIFLLTGGFPSLVRTVCDWWIASSHEPVDLDLYIQLLQEPNVKHRLRQIWDGLTQEEKAFMLVFAQSQDMNVDGKKESHEAKMLKQLEMKGVVRFERHGPKIVSELLAQYVFHHAEESRGKIWLNEETNQIFSGKDSIDGLSPIAQILLEFFIRNPHKRHSHNDLIDAAWPDDVQFEDGITTDALYQVISKIRKAIEPKGSKPQFVINRQGGYQFFPEGRPNV